MLPNRFYEGIRVQPRILNTKGETGLNIYHRLLLVLDLKITVILYKND